MVVNGIENELIIITKQTFDAFLRSDFPADLIALYNFYYYTAKWQETNQPKCTTGYTAEGLKWSEAKVRRAKKELMRLGLVEDVQQKVNGKVTGCFIKLNYIIKQENVHHPYDFSQCGNNEENNQIHPNDFPQGGNVHRVEKLQTNALSSNNINALSADNINALSSNTLASETDTKTKCSLKELENDFDGRNREIKSKYTLPSSLEINSEQHRKNCEAEKKKLRESNTENNTENNTPNKKTTKGFDAVVEEYTTNAELKAAVFDFIQFRKAIKAPLTDRALTLCLNKLDKLANNELEKIAVLNQSIERGWRGLFEVKDNSFNAPAPKSNTTAPTADDYNIDDIKNFWEV